MSYLAAVGCVTVAVTIDDNGVLIYIIHVGRRLVQFVVTHTSCTVLLYK